MKRTKRLGLFVLLILAGLYAGCDSGKKVGADQKVPTVPVVRVVRRDLSNDMEIASEFEPYQEVEVYAKVSGYIQKLDIDWGTHVKQGQLLAVLEVPELQEQLKQDEATANRSQNDLQRAQEEINSTQSAYNVAHLTSSRLSDVQKSQPGLIAQQDIDVAQGKDIEAKAGLNGAKDGLAAAEQAVIASKAALDKDKAMYEYARIVAPFDGVVTDLHAYTGALLPAGTSSNIGGSTLCRISQNNLLRLVIPVPERAVPDVHVGQTIVVKVNNKTFPGKITRFSGQIDNETRTMHTEVEVPNPNYELIPGMYASVDIPLHTAGNTLTVPIQAVQTTGEKKGVVMIVNSANTLEERNVVLGLQTATQIEIVSGLAQSDLVLFGGRAQYKPGQAVSPKIIEPPSLE